MHATYVRTFMQRIGKKVGIEKRVHPHGLRHTYAYELAVSEGKPLPRDRVTLAPELDDYSGERFATGSKISSQMIATTSTG